jgi:hypothetical protein
MLLIAMRGIVKNSPGLTVGQVLQQGKVPRYGTSLLPDWITKVKVL